MKASLKHCLLPVIVLLCACSGIKVEQDYNSRTNFDRLKVYAWQSDKQKATGDVRVDNSLLNDRIRESVDNSLSNKGYKKVALSKADYLVAYHYVIRDKDGHNYGPRSGVSIGAASGGRGSYGGISLGFGSGSGDYDQSELTIDVIEPKSGRILWRGVAKRKIISQTDPKKRTQRINETVSAILKKFPPGK